MWEWRADEFSNGLRIEELTEDIAYVLLILLKESSIIKAWPSCTWKMEVLKEEVLFHFGQKAGVGLLLQSSGWSVWVFSRRRWGFGFSFWSSLQWIVRNTAGSLDPSSSCWPMRKSSSIEVVRLLLSWLAIWEIYVLQNCWFPVLQCLFFLCTCTWYM